MQAQSHIQPLSPQFNGQSLELVQHQNQAWLTGEQIGKALGYAEPAKAILNLYQKNSGEMDSYSCTLKLRVQDANGVFQFREIRVYNEEGVMLLTMLSRQPLASQFRRWAVAVLKAARPQAPPALSGPEAREFALWKLARRMTKKALGQEEALDKLERIRRLTQAQDLCLVTQAEAAQMLGMDRSTLRYYQQALRQIHQPVQIEADTAPSPQPVRDAQGRFLSGRLA